MYTLKTKLFTKKKRNRLGWHGQWNSVIFTDKKGFYVNSPDEYIYYFHDLRKDEKFAVRPHRRKFGIMTWGAISPKRVVHLEILNGIQNAQKYRNLLIQVKPIIERITMDLPHDHAPVGTARLVNSRLKEENLNVLAWPSVSVHLNIVENVGQLANGIKTAWNATT